MAFYSLPEYFTDENGGFANCQLCVEYKGGTIVDFDSVVVRERSRGRHDPGDGPYNNRMAFGGETIVEVPGDDTKYLLQGSQVVTRVGTDYHTCFYEDWSNSTFSHLSVSDNQPRGWGYYLHVRAYYCDGWYFWRKSYTISDYGLTESEAKATALQFYNQFKGIGYDLLPGSRDFYCDGYRLTGAKIEREPKLSNQSVTPLETLSADYVNRRIETGLASAFVDACDKLPSTVGINSIANVADAISSFKSMSKGLTKVGSAADAWLGYRYSYTPTKSDITALSDFANRIAALPSTIRSNGYYKDGEYEYRVAINVSSPYLASLVSLGEKWGVALDAVNAWDLIPYSFIVDWFIPVSNMLERWQSQSFAMQIQQTSWCSVRHEYVNEFGFDEIDYSRFLYEPQARFASVSHIAYGPKASTIVKRALDVLALFA